jgi:hypothetical protein
MKLPVNEQVIHLFLGVYPLEVFVRYAQLQEAQRKNKKGSYSFECSHLLDAGAALQLN